MTTHDLLDSLVAHKASINLATSQQKNQALALMADQLLLATPAILAANALDLGYAKDKISPVMMDRLLLNEGRIAAMADGMRAVASLPDPVGQVLAETVRADGLVIRKHSVPFGLVGMIYESRPNVTADVVALAIKSGNAVILRGGKEAIHSSQAIVAALKAGIEAAGLSPNVIELVQDTDRQSARDLMTAKGKIDLLVPRGGAGLIQAVVEHATVPVIETGTGICHVYVDAAADLDKAVRIVENAKASRPSVCNAAEVLLVHEAVAPDFLPILEKQLGGRVLFRAEEKAKIYLATAQPALAADFETEFLDYILAVKLVSDVQEAVAHIQQHTTGHSEAIVTEDETVAAYFSQHVDAAAVYINASTRFTDGGEFGLGCELGISTQKMHARGPMGVQELTTYKYIITGDGHIR